MDFDEENFCAIDPATLSRITASEFNSEIAIRQRMTEAIHARIAWALLLKESLQTDSYPSSIPPATFKFVALDALKTSDKPTEFFLDREEPAPPNIWLQEELRLARPAPTIKAQPSRKSKTTFLFIRSANIATARNAVSESEFLILKCPVCSRTTFTSLQGLLNHARISHALGWGTHEECVRACATVDSDFKVQDGMEVGVGASGILPGLRTIFEMAVGPSHHNDAGGGTPTLGNTRRDYPTSSHLIRTLGLHEDTPALAPFLGKEPIRRGINAYEQEELVDVCSPIQNTAVRTVRAGVRFAQRGRVQRTEKMEVTAETGVHASDLKEGPCEDIQSLDNVPPRSVLGAATTRFHFATRIVVTDRSLSIDSDKGVPFSHKWMLTVDAPSYAHSIITILRSMRITPLSSVEVVRCSKPETNCPPFVIVGLASEPFLARIDLVFNGIDASDSSEGQPFSLEHWIDLDPLRCSTAVVGEEQICDVELDKRTHIGPSSEPLSTSYKTFWKLTEDLASGNPKTVQAPPTLAYERVLKDLLPCFPLTLQDVKKRRGTKPVPYKLVASESHFLDLVAGRRKAIEWGRVRALRDAFNEVVKNESAMDLSPLTAADVYLWMREEGHLRPHTKVSVSGVSDTLEQIGDRELGPQWCSLCGLERSLHFGLAKQEEDPLRQEECSTFMGVNCSIAAQNGSIVKLRPINIGHAQRTPAISSVQYPAWKYSTSFNPSLTQYVVRVTDPRLTLGVRRVIHLLRLQFFKTPSQCGSVFQLDQLGRTSDEVDSTLAPYALLAMCLRPFIHNIVLSGLDVAKRQKGFANARAFPRKPNKETQSKNSNVSLLTPAHILTGIRDHGRSGDRTDEAVLLCLSTIGTTFEPHRGEEVKFEKPIAVKMGQP